MFEAYDLFSKICKDTTGRAITEDEFYRLVNSNPEYAAAIGGPVAFMRVIPDMLCAEVPPVVSACQLPIKYDSQAFRDFHYVRNQPGYKCVLDKLLPSIAFSVSEDERANWTYEELHVYLVDGVTVGGHTVREQAIVDGVREAYGALPVMTTGMVSGFNVCGLHTALMRNVMEDKSQLGRIRTRDVRLHGINNWKSVPVEQLREVFERECQVVNSIEDVVERAIVAMMWLQYRQFFYDGNKRVSRFMCNAILGAEKAGVFCVPRSSILQYQRLLADFYETADATQIIRYTLDHCLTYFPDDKTTHWPE